MTFSVSSSAESFNNWLVETAAHSSILGWKIPWTEEPGRLYSPWDCRVGYDWATSLTHSSKALWVVYQQNLCQTWEWTFSAPWDKMVMKYPLQNHGLVYEQKGALPTEDWHLPSTPTKIKSWPLQLLTFNAPERSSGWKSGMRHSVLWEKLAEQAFR